MSEWLERDRAKTPGGAELVLYERQGEYVIRAGGRELMGSRAHGSEEALARLGCAPVASRPRPRILIGGLGLGFTLRGALDALPDDAAVLAVEIVPEVVEWCRGPLRELAGRPLEDPRVRVEVADVGRLLRTTTERFDALLLDVDNGPQALARRANQALYGPPGLEAARRALRRPGVLAVWSASPHPDFERRMRRAGFEVEVHRVPARASGRRLTHTIYVGLHAPPSPHLAGGGRHVVK